MVYSKGLFKGKELTMGLFIGVWAGLRELKRDPTHPEPNIPGK